MKTKLNTKTIVAAVASVIGLIRSGPRFAGCGRLLHPGQLSGF